MNGTDFRDARHRDAGLGRAIAREGIALVVKPAGLTSFQALAPLKRGLGTRKLGHTGTLDKFASGLLVILVGRLTRLGPWFTGLDKVYVAKIRFGEETDTLDPEGQVVATAATPSLASLEAILPRFRGKILQAPPSYSAIHVDGQRASARARRGETPELAPRPVTIHELELLDFDGRDAIIRVRCSSGTYIRSLARDIARALDSRSRLEALERLSVGPFSLGEAFPPDSFLSPESLIALDHARAESLGFSARILPDRLLAAFANGKRINGADLSPAAQGLEGRALAIFTNSGDFLGVMEERGADELCYRFVASPLEEGAPT